jgi:putative ABC transport system permease protein
MINKLVLQNLKARWVRTVLSALVVGVQVMSILTLIGLSHGLLQQSANRARGSGADIFLIPDTGGTLSLSSGQLPEKFVPFIEKQQHVKAAVGVLVEHLQVLTTLSGVDFAALERMTGPIRFLAGGPPTQPNDLLVDNFYARQNRVKIGQTVKLLNYDWRIAGVIPEGILGRFLVPLRTLQQITGNANPARVSEILVKLDDPALADEMVTRFNTLLAGNMKAVSMAAFVSQFSVNNIPELKTFIGVITGIAIVVGFLVVFLSMYTAVIERTREIGILKALGAKPLTVVDILIREAIVLALLGWMIGVGLTAVARIILSTYLPDSLPVVSVPAWWPIAAAIALVGALLGAIYPGAKAARQDAVEALAYE